MSTLRARTLGRVLPGEVPVTLVHDVELSLQEGEFVAITGPSGSGKSSLLYLLGLLDVPTSGDVLLDGQPTASLDEETRGRLRLEHFGFVFQFHFLLPELTVIDNVMLPMRKLGRLALREARNRAEGLLESLSMTDQAFKRPPQLSGGQRQRTAIARALANEPRFLLADEPTGSLDTRNAAAVYEILREQASFGRIVVTVTHNPELAAIATRRVRLVDGLLVEDSASGSRALSASRQVA
jgi:lipoprotein-releasing system ATP-binding protein